MARKMQKILFMRFLAIDFAVCLIFLIAAANTLQHVTGMPRLLSLPAGLAQLESNWLTQLGPGAMRRLTKHLLIECYL